MAGPRFSFAGLGSSLGQRRDLRQHEGATSTESAGGTSMRRRNDIVRISRACTAEGKLARDKVVRKLGHAQAATEPCQVLDRVLPRRRRDRPDRSRGCGWCRDFSRPAAPMPHRPCQCQPHAASYRSRRCPRPGPTRPCRFGSGRAACGAPVPPAAHKLQGACLSLRETASAAPKPRRGLLSALSGLSRQACGLL